MLEKPKALVLMSGGLDSTTAVAHALDAGYEVQGLTITYGQKHNKEIECARKVANWYGIPLKELELPIDIWKGSNCTLLQGNGDIDEATYTEQIDQASKVGAAMIDTSVPFRNGIFLSVAAAYAYSQGCKYVVIAAHQDDSGSAYPDCSPHFLDSMNESVCTGTGHAVSLRAPFTSWTKDKIVSWGLAHGVPYNLTWSCYNGGEAACGKCATCRDRLKAFEKNNAIDPIKYMSESYEYTPKHLLKHPQGTYTICKEFEISGAHCLKLPYESKCTNVHGHNWKIRVHCKAKRLNTEGMVTDFVHIKKFVTDKYDHRSLNTIPPFDKINPTSENFARVLCEDLEEYGCYKVEVREAEGSWASYEI